MVPLVHLFCTLLGFSRCLECTRVRIHKHLFVSFIINNLLWLAWYTFVTGSPSTLLKEPVTKTELKIGAEDRAAT